MPIERLRTALETLKTEISSTEGLDDESRELLVNAMRTIADKLEASADDAPDDGLGESIRSAVERFEGEHPELMNAVTRVAEALGAAGL